MESCYNKIIKRFQEKRFHRWKMKQLTMEEVTGMVLNRSFGAVDGPGIRFIVFLQGCQMRCQYCHNQILGQWNSKSREAVGGWCPRRSTPAIIGFWERKGESLASGGEALLQIDFLIALLLRLKSWGYCYLGYLCPSFPEYTSLFGKIRPLDMAVTDLVLLDIKEINDERHKNCDQPYQ